MVHLEALNMMYFKEHESDNEMKHNDSVVMWIKGVQSS
jgi:hypothetical protein